MDLAKVIATWPASTDEVLVGTKYEGADETAPFGFSPEYKAWKILAADAKTNAAKAELQAALIAELVGALDGLRKLYNTDEGCRSTPQYKQSVAALSLAQQWQSRGA